MNTRDDGSFIDGYFWFWIKNVGPVYLLMLPAALNAPPKLKGLCLGALLVYAAAELYQFQPNVYDNNKLFYVAFADAALVGRLPAPCGGLSGGYRAGGSWRCPLAW